MHYIIGAAKQRLIGRSILLTQEDKQSHTTQLLANKKGINRKREDNGNMVLVSVNQNL